MAIDLLERLTVHRRPSGRWPVKEGSRQVYVGWCHGSAGWAQTWALAAQLTVDERFLDLARSCAEDAVGTSNDNASLCCGRAGQGFSALTLYRATGEERWLSAAHGAAGEAATMSASDETPAHRLFTGLLGVALLAMELDDPDHATMPVYEGGG